MIGENVRAPESSKLAVASGSARRPLLQNVAFGGSIIACCLVLAACGSHDALSPAQRLNAGLTAFSRGEYSTARSDYRTVLRDDPTNKSGLNKIAWYDLGVLDQKLGDTSAAISEYQQALLLDPKYSFALYNLAVVESPSNPDGAIALYQQALAISPKNPNVRWNLGLLLYSKGHINQGRALLKSAIKIDPNIASRLPKDVRL